MVAVEEGAHPGAPVRRQPVPDQHHPLTSKKLRNVRRTGVAAMMVDGESGRSGAALIDCRPVGMSGRSCRRLAVSMFQVNVGS
jgi:hypothetical protein